MRKAKKKKVINLHYSLSNSFKLIFFAFISPITFIRTVVKNKDLRSAVSFFLTVFVISSLLRTIHQTILFRTPSTLFLGITSILLFMPIGLTGLWLLNSGFYVILKLLGRKLSLKKISIITCYSFAPLILSQLPIVAVIGWIYLIFLLSAGFYLTLGEISKAIISVVTPFLLILILAFMFGFLNLSLLPFT